MNKPASPRRPLRRSPSIASPRTRWLPAASVLAGGLLGACAPAPDPYFIDRDAAIAEDRFLRVIHSPDPIEEEPPPIDQEGTDEQAGGVGRRHKGEEGKMGKPTSRSKSGLYAMKGPRDASYAVGGLGLVGTGRGGGGTGEGTIGLGCSSCGGPGDDKYGRPDDNLWARVLAEPLSTFSIDVDTASYSNVRRFLQSGSMPPTDAVRAEELINYFDYDYPQPTGVRPFSVHAEVAACPWNSTHKLVHIGLQGKALAKAEAAPRNLVFLIDVSGSMSQEDKLPLLREGLRMLVDDMGPRDRISMVAYAGASGLGLPPTSGADKPTILGALDRLEAGGSTNGGAGIALAYAQARKHFIPGGVNRVLLASDGDFNVGVTDHDELIHLVEQQRKSGVYLSVLGFGRGNLNDHMMEQIADKGNGNYAYIDSRREAKKVLVHEGAGTLVTIAKDVKLQVEFNPATVAAYRLIGYENRKLAAQDFKDDRKDAGELGAGHSVTGLYEIVPAGTPAPGSGVDALKYQKPVQPAAAATDAELFTVKLRYKQPDSDTSTEFELAVPDADRRLAAASPAFKFAAAVAAFAQRLRDPVSKDGLDFAQIHQLADSAGLPDPHGYRKEFLQLVDTAGRLTSPAPTRVASLVDDELGR